MTRLILIDHASGYIFCDTSDALAGIDWVESTINPLADCNLECAARAFDESIGEYGRTYTVKSQARFSNESGYRVYDPRGAGADVVAHITDGQDADMIEAVERDCRYVAFVAFERGE